MKTRRIRRSPQKARALVLKTIEDDLLANGPTSFNLLDIAEKCGIAHSTILHHFGTVDALKAAFTQYILENILIEAVAILQPDQPQVLTIDHIIALFIEKMGQGQRGGFLVWLILNPVDRETLDPSQWENISTLLQELARVVDLRTKKIPIEKNNKITQGQAVPILVATSLIGHLLTGSFFGRALGMEEKNYNEGYMAWFADLIADQVGVDPDVRQQRKDQQKKNS